MKALVATLVAFMLVAPVHADQTDLLFPDGKNFARLRIEVSDTKSPEVAWGAFLDKLFAHFDRDADGALSEAEAKRVFLMPGVPREIKPDFAAMDADRDGKVSPAEFRTFYRDRGFAPVTVVLVQPPTEALALGKALFEHLDRDADGKLSATELKQAVALLKRFDENEDEVLTEAELLGPGPWGRFTPAGLRPPTDKAEPTAVLKLALDGKPVRVTESKSFRLAADGPRLQVPGGSCYFAPTTNDTAAAFREAKKFFAAVFRDAAGNKPATKEEIERQPGGSVLVGMFDSADRDGDGKLTRAELDAFFDLVELGVECFVIVVATDRGRNLFDLFDTNSDGRLDLGELNRVAKTSSGEPARDGPLERGAVPASYRLEVHRGPFNGWFGPVEYGIMAGPKRVPPRAARGPKWFLALDKNGDGFVSAREFVGSPELFAKLDTNADGRISAEEAEAAKP